MCQLHWLLLVDFGSELCVFMCLSVYCPMCQYTGRLLLVDFGSGLSICRPMCQLHCLFASRLRQWVLCFMCFSSLCPMCQLHWLFASRLRQWVVCFSSLCPMCQLHWLLLVDFGSGLFVLCV